MGQFNSLNIFLRQEIDRMEKVIEIVKTTLRDLLLAIEGTIIMSEVSFKKILVFIFFLLARTKMVFLMFVSST